MGGVSKRNLAIATTAGVWAAYFAVCGAGLLLDEGASAHAAWVALSLATACGVGAGFCLAVGRGLDRLGGRPLAVRLFAAAMLANLAAIAWMAAGRLAIFPAWKALFGAAGWIDGSFAGAATPHDSTFLLWMLFLAWTGLRLALSPSDEAPSDAAPAYETDLWISSGRDATRLPVAEVRWFEAERDYVRAHLRDGRRSLLREPMHVLMGRLDPARFRRIHRSTIVNLAEVTQIRGRGGKNLELVLAGGERLAVGRSYQKSARSIAP